MPNKLKLNIALLLLLIPLFQQYLHAEQTFKQVKFVSGDTIQPPPGSVSLISGPLVTCTGDTSLYTTDIPVSCMAQWYVNGILQPSTTDTLQVVWQVPGLNTISLYFNCNGTVTFADSAIVETGAPPEVDLGNDTVINQGETLILDAGNPGSSYLWSTGDTTQTIQVSTAGYYSVSVENCCGIDNDTIFVDIFDMLKNNRNKNGVVYFKKSGNKLEINILNKQAKHITVAGIDGTIYYDGIFKKYIPLGCVHNLIVINIVFSDNKTGKFLFFK